MANRYWCCGFELGANGGYPEMVLSGAASISAAEAHGGVNSLYCDGSAGDAYATNPTWYVGSYTAYPAVRGPGTRIYLYPTLLPASGGRIFAKWLGGTGWLGLRLNPAGTVSVVDDLGTVYGTSAATVTVGAWNMIGWPIQRATSSPYTITVKLLIGGVLQFEATSSRPVQPSTLQVGWQDYAAGKGARGYFDDLAVKVFQSGTVTAPGKGLVQTLAPNGNGSGNYWLGSTGLAYACVDEIPCDLADYAYPIEGYPIGGYAVMRAALATVTAPDGANGCCATAVLKRSAGSDNYMLLGVTSGYTEYAGSPGSVGAAWGLHAAFVPELSLAQDVINGLQGYVREGLALSGWGRCAQLMVHIDIAGAHPEAPTNLAPTGTVVASSFTLAGDYVQGEADAMAGVQVQVYDSSGTVLLWDSGEVAATGTRWLLRTLYVPAAGVTVKWRARNMDAAEYWGSYCALQSLTINAAPTAPTGCAPSGGATAGDEPTLEWTHGDPDADGQTDSELEIRRCSDGALVSGYPLTSARAIDTFNRADNPATLGSDESQPTPKPWTVLGPSGGTWGVLSNRAYCVSNTGGSLAVLDAGVGDGTLRCQMKREALQELGLVFRCDGTDDNYWLLHFVAAAVQGIRLRLSVIVGAAAPETVATSVDLDIADQAMAALKVVLSGALITAYLEGTQVLNVNDARLAAHGRVGLYCPVTAVPLGAWDDFSLVTAAGATQSHDVPPATLTIGTQYQWKVRTRDGWLWGQASAWNVFYAVDAPECVISSPTEAEVVTSAQLNLSWNYSGGTGQSSFRVVVYSDDLGTLVYDSGQQAGAATSWTVPMGWLLNNRAYQLKVYVWDSTPVQGQSGWRSFETQWAAPPAITGLAASAVVTGNPHVVLTWDMSGLGSEFVEYRVYRRLAGQVLWTCVAAIENKAVVGCSDYSAPLGLEVEYSVRQVEDLSGEILESPDSLTASVTLDFQGTVLHDTTDPSSYVVLVYSPTHEQGWQQQKAEIQYWARTAPVMEFGPARYRRLTLSFTLVAGDSAKLAALSSLQADHNVLCYRDGRGEKAYCNFADDLRTGYRLPSGWTQGIGLVESDYVEAVT